MAAKNENKTIESLFKEGELKKFYQVKFYPDVCKELENFGIPYPNDAHMFLKIDGDRAFFNGMAGGQFNLPLNTPVRSFSKL